MTRGKSVLARLRHRVAVAGYTMVEVMMAVAVLAVGLLGVAAMQTGAIGGNIQAQETTMATSLARLWIERLRRDGASWSTPVVPLGGPVAGQINNTRFLREVATLGWVVPAVGAAIPGPGLDPYTSGTTANESAAFDHWGRDVSTVSTEVRYCTQIRVAWVYPGTAVRADVRVFWHKRLRGEGAQDAAQPRVACNTGAANAALNVARGNAAGRGQMMRHLSAVYVSTIIRYTPLRFGTGT